MCSCPSRSIARSPGFSGGGELLALSPQLDEPSEEAWRKRKCILPNCSGSLCTWLHSDRRCSCIASTACNGEAVDSQAADPVP